MCTLKKEYDCLFLHKELNLGQIFDTAGCRASLTFFRVDPCFDFIIINTDTSCKP